MQTIAELTFLQVAHEAIDRGDRFRRSRRCWQTQILLYARGARFLADRGDKTLAPRRIEAVGGRIFVKQLLEPDEVLRQRADRERRREMTDRDRSEAPLGLRGFTG